MAEIGADEYRFGTFIVVSLGNGSSNDRILTLTLHKSAFYTASCNASRYCNSSVSTVSLAFMDSTSLPAGRSKRPAR